jgi:tetratricopeptide (TPR) repeat protein
MSLFSRAAFAVRRWWMGRQWRLLWPGVPALVVGVAAVGVVGYAVAEGTRDVTGRYLEMARARYRAGDYAGAMTCYDRLAHLGSERPEVMYGLARTAEALGYDERALVLMRELAPPDEKGFGEAHLWWATRLLRLPHPTGQYLDLAERHLLNAIDAGVSDRGTAHGLLGELYLRRGKLDQAEFHLKKAVDSTPQLALRLAEVYLRQGDRARAEATAEQAVKFFQAWTKAELYERQGRLGLADAHLLLGKHRDAEAVLQVGLNATGDPEYRRALSRLYLAWSQHVAATKKDSIGEQLDLIEKALAIDPDNHELVVRLWAMTKAKGKAADDALAVLRKQLSSGKATAMTHLALGMHLWENGKKAEGLLHLEQAYKAAPGMAVVANNLAWLLAESQPPDLKRALELMNTVLERWPREPMFRDTRGHIYYRLGNWKEALSDYQVALPHYAATTGIHRRLTEVYTKLGMKEMAAEHARRAEEIERAAAKKKPGR